MLDNATTRVAKLQSAAAKLYEDFQVVLAEHKEIPWAEGEARVDDAFDCIDEVLDRLGAQS